MWCKAASTLPAFEAETKRGDSRYQGFIMHDGTQGWKRDALNPVTLRERAQPSWWERELETWTRYERVEVAERASLAGFLQFWHAAQASHTTLAHW